MRYLVDGKVADLQPIPDVRIAAESDRLTVGTFGTALVRKQGGKTWVSINGVTHVVEPYMRGAAAAVDSNGELRAPLPSTVVEVLCREGEDVSQGDRLVILEAMKMQTPLVAPFAGRVERLLVTKGDQVPEGFVVVVVDKADA